MIAAFPLLADLEDGAAAFMADDGGALGDVVGDALVFRAAHGGLVAGHAEAVADDVGEDFVVADRGEVELVEAEVVLPVKADGPGPHG